VYFNQRPEKEGIKTKIPEIASGNLLRHFNQRPEEEGIKTLSLDFAYRIFDGFQSTPRGRGD